MLRGDLAIIRLTLGLHSESRDERAVEQFSWIPASVLENVKFQADLTMA